MDDTVHSHRDGSCAGTTPMEADPAHNRAAETVRMEGEVEAITSMARSSLSVSDRTGQTGAGNSASADNLVPAGPVKKKKKRRCGAERNRVRKAKLALQAQADLHRNATPSTSAQMRNVAGGSATGQPGAKANKTGSSGATPRDLGLKRLRPSDSMPPEAYSAPKRGREVLRPRSYGEALESGRRVVIAPAGYPDTTLSEEQGDLVARALCVAMDAIPEADRVPRFERCRCDQGVLWVTGTDDEALRWLRSAVPSLAPWEGASLQILERERLPRLTRMSLVVHGILERTDVILRRLKRQNPGLQTHLWRVWDRRDGPKMVHLTLGVDPRSRSELREGGYQAHYGLWRVSFREAHQGTADGAEASTSETGAEHAAAGAREQPAEPTTALATGPTGAGGAVAVSARTDSGRNGQVDRETQNTSTRPEGSCGPPTQGRPSHGSRGRPTRAAAVSRAGLEEVRAGVQRTLPYAPAGTEDARPKEDPSRRPPTDRGEEGAGK